MGFEQSGQRCVATTKAGPRCKRPPTAGSTTCSSHAGLAVEIASVAEHEPQDTTDRLVKAHDAAPAAGQNLTDREARDRDLAGRLQKALDDRGSARAALPGSRPQTSHSSELPPQRKGSHPIIWIIAALVVLGAIVGQGTDSSGTYSTNVSVAPASLCETNWQQRDPSFSSNNHAEFIRNCEAGSQLLVDLKRCPPGAAGERCAAEALDKDFRNSR